MLLPLLRAAKIMRIFFRPRGVFRPERRKGADLQSHYTIYAGKSQYNTATFAKIFIFPFPFGGFVAEGTGRDDYTLFAGEEKKSVRAAAFVSASAIKGIRVV